MMALCTHPNCGELVDIDPWIAYPAAFDGVPHLCNEHVMPHVDLINAKIDEIKRDAAKARKVAS